MAQEVIERVHELSQYADTDNRSLSGELRVGASNTIGNYLVGDLLGPFAASQPNVSLQVSVENTATIAAGLVAHRLDVGCIEGPINHPQLESFPWREDALVVCAAPSHLLAGKKPLKAHHFKDARWILREPGSAMRTQTEQALSVLPRDKSCLNLARSRRSSRL